MTNKLEVRNLSKQFISPGGPFSKARAMHAVNDVSFDLPTGRVSGVVGESGCGKSTLARLILRLIEPTTGSLSFDGDDLLAQPPAAMRRLRADMQMVFQDPYSAIDPRFTVGRAVMEPFEVQGRKPAGTHAEEIDRLLTMVGLNPGLANNSRTRFPAARNNVSASPAHWPCAPPCWCWTNPQPRSTCRFRHKSSACSKSCAMIWG